MQRDPARDQPIRRVQEATWRIHKWAREHATRAGEMAVTEDVFGEQARDLVEAFVALLELAETPAQRESVKELLLHAVSASVAPAPVTASGAPSVRTAETEATETAVTVLRSLSAAVTTPTDRQSLPRQLLTLPVPLTQWQGLRIAPTEAVFAMPMEQDSSVSSLTVLPPPQMPPKRKRVMKQTCTYRCKMCGTTETTEWRRGPDNCKSLCNACGLHYAKIVRKEQAHPVQEKRTVSVSSLINDTSS